jgi:hypothetical protein
MRDESDSAFPLPPVYCNECEGDAIAWTGADGMTIREWYAGMALTGVLTDPQYQAEEGPAIAERSFEIADAMLAESQKARRS